jgi:hypothetical protein
MVEQTQLLIALAVAALVAATVFLLSAWPWRTTPSWRVSVGGILAVGLGFAAGVWLVGTRPHWPPREDMDRLLLILFPAILMSEALAAALQARLLGQAAWALRLAIAAGAAPLLLYQSTYLAELAGPGSREWTPLQSTFVLAGLAVALIGMWCLLAGLLGRTPSRSVPLALAFACAGAGVTVMLSGYASGGMLGLPLAAALVGGALASFCRSDAGDLTGLLGIGVVGLFALLVIGRFFGELSTANAVLLFLVPLLGWLPELVRLRWFGPWCRGWSRLALTAIPVAVVLMLAKQKYAEESAPTPANPLEATSDDYLQYRK